MGFGHKLIVMAMQVRRTIINQPRSMISNQGYLPDMKYSDTVGHDGHMMYPGPID